jgi:tRNA dimethylallyltransferase
LGEYIVDNKQIDYHLIDIVAAGGDYNLYQFQQDFERVYADIQERKATPILCGGSGLYIQAVVQEYQLGQKSEMGSQKSEIRNQELGIKAKNVFGLTLPLELRRTRITNRLQERLQAGMIDEVQQLINEGVPPEKLIYYGLEYKFITQYLIGELDYKTMVERLNIAIHQFAKRQMTYFRKMEKDGVQITWLDGTLPLETLTDELIKLLR